MYITPVMLEELESAYVQAEDMTGFGLALLLNVYKFEPQYNDHEFVLMPIAKAQRKFGFSRRQVKTALLSLAAHGWLRLDRASGEKEARFTSTVKLLSTVEIRRKIEEVVATTTTTKKAVGMTPEVEQDMDGVDSYDVYAAWDMDEPENSEQDNELFDKEVD